jgi:tetratricopeptide (TPR) repeat protein
VKEDRSVLDQVSKLIDKREHQGNLDQAIERLQELRATDRDNDLIHGKLSHAFYYKGWFANHNRERLRWFEQGKHFGKRAITLNPEAIYGTFWYGINLGMWGQSRGILSSLKALRPLSEAMEHVLNRNEAFFFAGPHRALGRIYHKVPGWPVSIGNKNKAVAHLERSVELGPRFFLNRIYLAELYLDVKRHRLAKGQLEWLLDTPIDPDHAVEDGAHRERAEELWIKHFG